MELETGQNTCILRYILPSFQAHSTLNLWYLQFWITIRSYYTTIVLRCRTADSCNVTALRCRMKDKIHFNLISGDAAVTCGRNVIDISAQQRNWGVVWRNLNPYGRTIVYAALSVKWCELVPCHNATLNVAFVTKMDTVFHLFKRDHLHKSQVIYLTQRFLSFDLWKLGISLNIPLT